MDQKQADDDDRREIARRLFKALCRLYPDRYIALVQPHDVVSTQAHAYVAIEAPVVR
jgi:hypothetical protein